MSGEGLAAVILAGGRSRRMGCEKALLELGGETLIERLARRLAASFERILVSTGSEPVSAGLGAALERLRAGGLAVEAVADRRADFAGPLAGVEAALGAVGSGRVFFISVDLVDPDAGLMAVLLEVSSAEGCLGAVPVCGGIIQGAFAVYSAELLPGVGSLLDGGEARLQELAGAGGVATVELEDSAADLFQGLNTPAEYDTLRSSLGEDGA